MAITYGDGGTSRNVVALYYRDGGTTRTIS